MICKLRNSLLCAKSMKAAHYIHCALYDISEVELSPISFGLAYSDRLSNVAGVYRLQL